MTAAVTLRSVSRHFGSVKALDDVDLEVGEGEFFAMLGPSGSGKTTCLRLIAGFEQPTLGQIRIFGEAVEGVPPYRRNVNTVFQDYALFPHMNVRDNVAFSLMLRKLPRAERIKAAEEALELVRLGGYGDRRPGQLSGGQRQRVALARAIVNKPKVLLLDEPLGALDLKLRESMQEELKALQKALGITFIFVTHDQDEALTMSDRIAVFNRGQIEQIGSAAEVYEQPASEFVAGFVGSCNLLKGDAAQKLLGRGGTFSVRPEKIHISTDLSAPVEPGMEAVKGTVAEVVYAGSSTRFVIDLEAGARLVAVQQNLQTSSTDVLDYRNATVLLTWKKQHCIAIDDRS